jgi:predicted DNA-binding helix-hairpin-helix protein
MAIAIRVEPDARDKVEVLGRAAQYDVCGEACGTDAARVRGNLDRWIYPAVMPDGKRVALLKVLMTNVCERNCAYCANRIGRDAPRTTFSPDELARLFDQMRQRKLVQGLFLSSGIAGGSTRTMDRMLATVELVRQRYAFDGYVHLKLLPGSTRAQVERAGQLAQRVSVNLEAPNMARLSRIAPNKGREELLEPMRWASEFIRKGGGRWAPSGQTTQFVVGAADESDHEILSTTSYLYQKLDLHRAYYSAFQPVRDTPLEGKPHTPTWREHRLYQCDFLFRLYGFDLEELVFAPDGNLPRSRSTGPTAKPCCACPGSGLAPRHASWVPGGRRAWRRCATCASWARWPRGRRPMCSWGAGARPTSCRSTEVDRTAPLPP